MTCKFVLLRQSINQNPPATLALIAGASGLIYALVFTVRFPLHRLYTTIPPVDYSKLTRYTPADLAAFVLGISLLFALYLWAISLTAPRGDRPPNRLPSLRAILMSSAGLAIVSIPAYPLTAIDLFIYAIRTRGWGLYGLNPLATAPKNLPAADPWLGLAGEWVDAPSPYGPLWEWLSLTAYYLSRGDFLWHLFALKIITALAYLGCVWLVYHILTRHRPAWVVAGTIAFAWNPLVLLESIQNGHNDILMIFFLLAAIASSSTVWGAGQEGRKSGGHTPVPPAYRQFLSSPQSPNLRCLLVILFLALSILVKYVPVVAVPFFLLAMTHNQKGWVARIAKLALYGLLIIAAVVLLMLPLWPGWDVWAVPRAGSGAGRSLTALAILALKAAGVPAAFDLGRGVIQAVFGLIYLYYLGQTFRAWLSNRPLPPWSPTFFVLFWYVLLAAPVFHAWYLLWFAPLASLFLPDRRPLNAAVVFSITALLVIPYFETVRVWYPILLKNHLLGHLIGVPLLIIPPIVAILRPIGVKTDFEV